VRGENVGRAVARRLQRDLGSESRELKNKMRDFSGEPYWKKLGAKENPNR